MHQRQYKQERDNKQAQPKSRIYQNYKNHIEYLIKDTELSFDSIQTPGWTSIVNTQNSKSINIHKKSQKDLNNNNHIQILKRLSSLPKLQENQNYYTNIRVVPSSAKNKNIIVYGSVQNQQQKKVPTPKSNQRISENKFKSSSHKKGTSPNKFLNRFSSNKPQIFFSVEKNQQTKRKQSSRKKTQSVKSQPSHSLKDMIKQRLSMGNNKEQNITSNFESIPTDPNQNQDRSQRQPKDFKLYSKIHSFFPVKQQKHQYLNRYLKKLNQREKEKKQVKIFKKNYQTQYNRTQSNPPSAKSKENHIPLTQRFKAITVHQHLHQDNIKLKNKKNIEKMIEESYKKAMKQTFTPFISEKSNFLAQSKFSRASNAQNGIENKKNCYHSNYHSHQNCFSKANKKSQIINKQIKRSIFTINEQVSLVQKQNIVHQSQDKTLRKLFAILSDGSDLINDKTLEANIQNLPLSLLQILEPFLTLVYKKNSFTQKDFLSLFLVSQENEIKSLYSKRILIVGQVEKYLRRTSQNKDKQNQMQNLNLQRSSSQQLKLKI